MSGPLALQEPALDWAGRAARDELDGLAWVDLALDPSQPPWSAREHDDGARTLKGADLLATLPPPIADLTREAAAQGQTTVWEALGLLVATAEWATATRGLLWSPCSPRPALLARLAAAFGVAPEVHRGDPEALARLAAGLPAWRGQRGTRDYLVAVVHAAGRDAELAPLALETFDAPAGEIFTCHGAAWWHARSRGPWGALRITAGWVRVAADGPVALAREDVILRAAAQAPLDPHLCRLLPIWTVLRPALSTEPSP